MPSPSRFVVIITALHIVLGELAPKPRPAAQRRDRSLGRPASRPVPLAAEPGDHRLNGLGNLVLRLFGLRPGTGEASLHSASELKLIIAQSQEAGLLQEAQEEIVARTLDIGKRVVGEIMTPRTESTGSTSMTIAKQYAAW